MVLAFNYIVKFVVFNAIIMLFLTGSVTAADSVVARVGNTGISEKELEEAIDMYIPKGGFHSAVSKEKRDEYRKPALELLIEKELLFQDAKRKGLKVSKEEIEAVTKLNEERFGSRTAFLNALKAEGKTLQQFQQGVEREALISKIARIEIDEKSVYSDQEIEDYYNRNREKFRKPDSIHIWHILISINPEITDKERQTKKAYAQEVLGKVKAGEDFSAVAEKYSEDAYRVKGGDLGYIHKGRLTTEVEEAAFKLKEGEISDVIESIYGFHIIKAGDRKGAETVSLEEIKSKLRWELESSRYETNRLNYVNSLKEKINVLIY